MARLALSCLSIALVLLALELALRVGGYTPESAHALYSFHDSEPVLGWIGKPNLRQRFVSRDFDVIVEHDALGFRRADPEPPAGAARAILVLGDSFTWGAGVGQGELFTDHLQRRLAPGVAVVNRGLNGISTGQEYLLLERELAARRFDLVLLQFTPNDVEDNVDAKEGRRPTWAVEDGRLVATNPHPLPLMSPLRRWSKDSRALSLIAFRWNLLDRQLRGMRPSRERERARKERDLRDEPGFEVTVRLLRAMDGHARAHGAAFFLVQGHPDPPQHAEAIGELCARAGVAMIDLVPALREAGIALTFESNQHWNPDGHRAVAEALLAAPELVSFGAGLSGLPVAGRAEGPAPAPR
jgi:lysophospholipase L1-like esterase